MPNFTPVFPTRTVLLVEAYQGLAHFIQTLAHLVVFSVRIRRFHRKSIGFTFLVAVQNRVLAEVRAIVLRYVIV